jgi:ribonucleases P/MRP protein subunit RPP40
MAEEFNQFFVSVFNGKETLIDSNVLAQDGPVKPLASKLENIVITEELVMKQLDRLRADKSTGADNLSGRLLSEIRNQICYPLMIIFRKSLSTGDVPVDWRLANISPIYKKGGRESPGNYRPVSLTSQICKMFESILREAIVDHLECNGLIKGSQHGFRRGRSCLTNLLSFLDCVTHWMDDGNCADIIYLDFAKAFDKVPHCRLLYKLRQYGIDGKLGDWIASWLKGRQQRVVIGGEFSEWRPVMSGVPQGSVLGPVLFLVFIDDIDDGVTNSILKFADDTKLFGVVNDLRQHDELQQDLQRLVDWSARWLMEFNAAKCTVIHVGRNNERFEYVMGTQTLTAVEEERDLGVVITADMKCSVNCQVACSKAQRILGMLKRSITHKSTDVLVPLYKSLVRPIVEYCTPVWSPHYIKDKRILERIQHRFSRLIPHLCRLPYDDRLNVLKLWSLEERRNRADLVEMFKICKGLSGIKLHEMFELALMDKTRGHLLKIRKGCCHLDIRKFFFSERVVSRWNSLDVDAVAVATVNAFKRQLDRIRQKKTGFFTDNYGR